jgi:hypothetical protein
MWGRAILAFMHLIFVIQSRLHSRATLNRLRQYTLTPIKNNSNFITINLLFVPFIPRDAGMFLYKNI